MKRETVIQKLIVSLRRDLKYRFIVWLALIGFFVFTAWWNAHKALRYIELLAKWQISSDASPEFVRLSAIQAMIPIGISMALFTFSMAMCAYCIMELIRPRTEGKLLLKMLETKAKNEEANNGIEPIR